MAANSWKIHEHLGSHIDAPIHFIENQKSVDEIKPEDLIVPVVVIDMEEKASKNSDAMLNVGDIIAFEKKYDDLCTQWRLALKSSFIGLDDQQIKHYP